MLFKDNIPVEEHLSRKDDRAAALENMPTRFGTLEEASNFGKLIHCRAWHFLCVAWSYDEQATRSDVNMALFDRHKAKPTPQAYAERDKYRDQLERFHSSIEPLVKGIDIMKDKKAWLTVQCWQVFLAGLQIGPGNCFEKDEVSYDRVTPKFLEMLNVSKSIIGNNNHPYFIPNTQVVHALSVIAQKCRNPSIRREVIHSLRSMNTREMFCDSGILAAICEWIVGVEEEGMLSCYMPEEARTRGVIIAPDHERQGMFVSCKLPKKSGEPGEMVTRETLIKW